MIFAVVDAGDGMQGGVLSAVEIADGEGGLAAGD